MLIALQVEVALRGLKRIWYVFSSMRLRTPSIQLTHSASSTASSQTMLGLPRPFLWKPTISSVACAECWASQARKSAAAGKKVGIASVLKG